MTKEELEKEISILLSCKNCPENKGGYICEKEHNDKCLAQKIQYIKELKEENAELKHNKKTVAHLAGVFADKLEKENEALKLKLEALEEQTPWKDIKDKSEVIGQLAQAKEIIKEYINLDYVQLSPSDKVIDLRDRAEQFLEK